jgi:hypothetical protein
MTKRVMHRLAKALCFRSKGSFPVLQKVSDAHIKVGLVAAVLFALAYAVETYGYEEGRLAGSAGL